MCSSQLHPGLQQAMQLLPALYCWYDMQRVFWRCSHQHVLKASLCSI